MTTSKVIQVIIAKCDGYWDVRKYGSWAFVIEENGYIIHKSSGVIICKDSIIAEYQAVIECLKYLLENGYKNVTIYTDCKSIAEQLNGNWHTDPEKEYYAKYKIAKSLKSKTESKVKWISRENNRKADTMCYKAIKRLCDRIDRNKY